MRYAVPLSHRRSLSHFHRLPWTPIRRGAHKSARFTIDITQPTEPSENGARTLRSRRHGNKSLPLPPIIDPKTVESRQRHKTTKARRYEGGKTELQKALHENVYGTRKMPILPPAKHSCLLISLTAQALASPVRQCGVTMALLPSHFMVPFVGSIEAPPTPATVEQRHPPRTRAHVIPQGRELMARPGKIISRTTYISSNYAAVDRLNNKTSSRGGVIDTAMSEWYAKKAGRSVKAKTSSKDWLWIDDNADKVLEILREEASYRLKRVRKSTPVTHPTGTIPEESQEHVVCLLKMKEEIPEAEHRMAHVPTFDLTALLDASLLDAVLEKQTDWKDSSWVAVNNYDHAIGLMLALLKLEQYVSPLQD
nr:hypothetical protein CFP56_69560 [Quercus suber]